MLSSTFAVLNSIVVDSSDNLIVSDQSNIRKIDRVAGTVTTLYTNTTLSSNMAIDVNNNLYFASSSIIYKMTPLYGSSKFFLLFISFINNFCLSFFSYNILFIFCTFYVILY